MEVSTVVYGPQGSKAATGKQRQQQFAGFAPLEMELSVASGLREDGRCEGGSSKNQRRSTRQADHWKLMQASEYQNSMEAMDGRQSPMQDEVLTVTTQSWKKSRRTAGMVTTVSLIFLDTSYRTIDSSLGHDAL
uniref:Uncharacterized protein n=1 Tax=Oryza brachyantha TaxID=4533 RepID=J3MUR1_ORYBR